jgi:hypothetical protein
MPKTEAVSQPKSWSAATKNSDATVTMTITARVVIHTSLRVGHVILVASWRTSLKNSIGLTIVFLKRFDGRIAGKIDNKTRHGQKPDNDFHR